MTPPANVLGVFHRIASNPVGVHDDDVTGGLQGGDGRPVQADKVVAHGVYGAGEEGERGVSPVGHDECACDTVQRGVLQAAGFDVEEGALGLLPGVAVDEDGAHAALSEGVGDGAGGGAFAEAAGTAGDEGDGREMIHIRCLCGVVYGWLVGCISRISGLWRFPAPCLVGDVFGLLC